MNASGRGQRSRRWWQRVLLTLGFCLALGGTAGAQGSEPYEAADADSLFSKAMTLYDKGQYEPACALIEQSLKLDYGMAAQFRLAECYDKLGRTASARETYHKVLERARQAKMSERIQLVEERLEELKPRLSSLEILVPDDVAALPGFKLTLDGEPLGADSWKQARPLNPGTYQLRATADGYRPWEHEVSVSGPGLRTVNVPLLRSGSKQPQSPSQTETAGGTGASMYIGITMASVGLAALIASGALALVAKSEYDSSVDDLHCLQDKSYCSSRGIRIREDAVDKGTGAIVLAAGGGALLVTGVVLWIVAPGEGSAEPAEPAKTAWVVGLGPSADGFQLVVGAAW